MLCLADFFRDICISKTMGPFWLVLGNLLVYRFPYSLIVCIAFFKLSKNDSGISVWKFVTMSFDVISCHTLVFRGNTQTLLNSQLFIGTALYCKVNYLITLSITNTWAFKPIRYAGTIYNPEEWVTWEMYKNVYPPKGVHKRAWN